MAHNVDSIFTLETPRLRLRLMQADDLMALLAIFGDPQVMAAFDVPVFDDEQMRQWLQRNLDHQAQYGYGLFAVIHKESGTLIGDCGLEVMTINGREAAELGYDFRSDYWNQGYATEAAAAVRDYAFNNLHLPQFISLIRMGNEASRRVAEKIGMQLVEEYSRYDRRYWQYGCNNPNVS